MLLTEVIVDDSHNVSCLCKRRLCYRAISYSL